MRFLRPLAAYLVVLCSAAGFADTTKMVILLNGTPAGENTFTKTADGSFDSETNFSIGTVKVGGFVKGQMSGGKVTRYSSQIDSPGATVKISYSAGSMTATVNGKSRTVPFSDSSHLYGGNTHPQLFAATLLAAEKSIASNPATKTTKLTVFLLDVGGAIPMLIDQLPAKHVSIDGQDRLVRRFHATLANISMECDLGDADQVVAWDIPSQKLRFVIEGWNDTLFEDPLKKYPELSQATFKVKTDRGVKMTTRDGVTLVSDVVRPDDDAKHPAILVRTPYGRASEAINGTFYAERGYAYVAQDCRGREDSGGEWDPFVHEGKDGYDAVQWVAGQRWCDGNVGMIGGSYDGYVQWAAAVERPPALKCIVPQVSPPDAMRNVPYDHGVFALYLDLWWAKIVAGRTADFSSLQSSLPHPGALATLPLSKADSAVLGRHLEFYQKWLNRPTINEWKGWDFTYRLSEVTIPALHISGIWDGDEIGTHINWNTMRELGHKNQWIVFGPWTHAFNTTHGIGDVQYGDGAILDLDSLYVRWFDKWLKGKRDGMTSRPRAKVFVTGANKWVELSDWPDPSSKPQRLYFAPDRLVPAITGSRQQSYSYDPSKDTKIPKQLLEVDPSQATTKVSLAKFKRGTALLLKSAPFSKATAVSAPFEAKIYFRCSAQNTDLYASCLDIAPDGTAHVIGLPGKLRASYLEGMDKVRPLVPGKVYLATVKPWDYAHEFKKGHQFALAIYSSGFPIYSRNLGTVEPIAGATRMVAQRNTVLMSKKYPSSLSFYVLWERP